METGLLMGWKWSLAQRLELWWWKRYLAKQSPEDYLKWKINYWQKLLVQLPAEIWPEKGAYILDAGCGPAGVFTALPNYRVTAIDPLLDRYMQQLPHFRPEDWPHVTFQQSTLELLTVATKYPLGFCFNAINHVQDWPSAIERLTASIAEGGWLVLSSDVHRKKWTKQLFRTIPGDVLHPQQHNREDYVKELQQLGWKIHWEQVIKPGRIFDYWVVVAQKSPTV